MAAPTRAQTVSLRRTPRCAATLAAALALALTAAEGRAQEKVSAKFNLETTYFGNPIDNNFGEFHVSLDGDLLMTMGPNLEKSVVKHGIARGSHTIKAVYKCLGSSYTQESKVNVQENDVVNVGMIFKGQSWVLNVNAESASKPMAAVGSIELVPEVFEREVASEIVRTLRGTKRTVKRTRTIEHAVSVTDRDARDVTGSGSLFGLLNVEVKKRVEQEMSQTLKQTESVEQSIEIDGEKLPVVRLVWVERYRKGTAELTLDGTTRKVAFLFPLEIELRPEEVTESKS